MSDISEIWRFNLRRGNSKSPRDGACMMDAVSWFEYGTLGDHPACVCPVIAAFCRGINDALPDAERQKLKAYIPRVIGTRDTRDVEQERAKYLAWQAIRVFAPLALDAAGLHEHASPLRACSGTLRDAMWAATWAAAESERAATWAATWAAARAARAADAAAWAAEAAARAARAADAAARAARAADAAAWAAEAAAGVYPAIFPALDGVLAIGRQAPDFDLSRAAVAAERFAEAAT